jgi:hypothetical protein
MSERGKKWLWWISLLMLFISIGGLVFFAIYLDYGTNRILVKISQKMVWICVILLVISGLNLIVFLSFKYQDRLLMKYLAKYSIYLLPLVSIGFYFMLDYFDTSGIWIGIILVCLIIILVLLALIYTFIFREAGEIKGIIVLLSCIIISVIMQRFDFSLSAIEDLFLPGFVVLTAAGMYMFGLRCLLMVEKNGYLKSVSFLACTLTAFGSFLFLLKMQGEKVDIFELVYFIPAFLLTLIVLLSLPISGYIHWSLLHKRILKKIVVTSIFFLLIFSFRFLYPDFFKQIVLKQEKENPEFYLDDYKLPDKNGLEPD